MRFAGKCSPESADHESASTVAGEAPKVPQICCAAPANTPGTYVLAYNSAPDRSSRAPLAVKCAPGCPGAKSSSTVGRYALRV